MSDIQLSTMALYFIGAIVVAFVAIFALAWFIDLQRQAPKWILSLIFPIIVAAMCISALLTGRNVTAAEFELAAAAGVDSPMLSWVLRLATGLILALCFARLISVSQKVELRVKEGKTLFIAFLLYFATNVVLNNIFGTKPMFDQRAWYPLLIFTTIYFSRNKDKNYSIDATKISLFLFFLGCCIAAVAVPQMAVQRNYTGWIPGLDIRLWGIGSGPNSIGPLSVVFLLLVMHKPFANRLLQLLALATGLAVMVLSQSKTAWLCATICFPILWWGRMLHAPRAASLHHDYALRKLSGPLLICALGILAVSAAALYNVYSEQVDLFTRDEEIATLTGRTYIWTVALETWAENPLFGYGASMWDDQVRQLIGMEYAYHAHNQILQALSVAGVVGLAGLLFYAAVMFNYALAANKATRGLSLALFTIILIRSFTEAPFDLSGIFSGEFIMHLLLFRLILLKSNQPYPLHDMHAFPNIPRTRQQLGWG
ncbi:O-antigen ligase domain-containing protein [Noviherbaspirillum cavernae]|uniref:O-antigen ligase domain-containing protein n=1 Tax=Noviherbaspirillum cavernae TaxID=2320862 RepID=A0A418WZU0_9BURK|nr:O-antigen ligase family protein [Noviherbaspirillum cavernae]RJG05774.1 O-antigen ligase domain-containing protein [Noviherbaspirillum cavernae]